MCEIVALAICIVNLYHANKANIYLTLPRIKFRGFADLPCTVNCAVADFVPTEFEASHV